MVQGNVTVPPGAWCDLIDTSVTGNLAVGGDRLRIAGSTIGGNLRRQRQGASDPLSSGTNVVCNTTVNGNLALARQRRGLPVEPRPMRPNTVKGNP